MVVVFPQNMYNLLTNPFSCWSTGPGVIWDENYYNQNGLQQKALKGVLDRVLAPKDLATYDYLSNNLADMDSVPLSQDPLLGTLYFFKNFWYWTLVGMFYLLLG